VKDKLPVELGIRRVQDHMMLAQNEAKTHSCASVSRR
jgi:hypothetical protein